MSKKRWMRQHCKTRARQRYDLELSSKDVIKIRDIIQSNRAQFVSRSSLDRTLWDVNYDGTILRVVYSKRHKMPVTILCRESLEVE
jgi:hypothetical protein